jgi:hypothetical protein
MKSIYMKLLRYLKNTSERRSLDTVYLRTDYRKDVYTSLTQKERNDMSKDQNWIHDIIPRSQIDAMNKNGDAMVNNMKNGVNLMISASNQSAIELCKAWELTKNGHEDGFEAIAYFINGLISALEIYLTDESIDPYEEHDEAN